MSTPSPQERNRAALGLPEVKSTGAGSDYIQSQIGEDGMSYVGFNRNTGEAYGALHYKPMFLQGSLDFTNKRSRFDINLDLSSAWQNVRAMDGMTATVSKSMNSDMQDGPMVGNVGYNTELGGGNFSAGATMVQGQKPQFGASWTKNF